VSANDTLSWLLEKLPEEELRARHAEVEEQIQELIRTRHVLQLAIEARNLAVRGGGNGAQPVDTLGYRPGTTEAIRLVLADAPYRTLTTSQIMDALGERDWLPVDVQDTRKAVGATISRMVKRTGELESVGRARYRLREKGEAVKATAPKATAGNRLFSGSADGEAESKGA
jgi:hypothetical protein